NNRTLYQPRGKVLGGTSSINGMVYMRGTSTDYDNWRQRGCEGWDWDSVLPFFKKAEDQERGADEFHGVGGPLHVSNPVRSPLGDAMVAASIEAGIPANPDFNGARQEGVGYYQTTTTNRRRWSSARAYLGQARGRQNLTIATNAHATRILFEGGRAVGVEYHAPDGPKTAWARGEIIASGGVYGSPQPLRPSVECRDLCRRPRPHRHAAGRARSADQHVGMERYRAAAHRDQAASVFGLHLQPGASAPRRPRVGADQEPGPPRTAGDPI